MEHMERTHSLLSPSGAHRWLVCTPSARAEEAAAIGGETGESEYAQEGTLAHEWAAYFLTGKDEPFEDATDEMKGYSRAYTDFVKALAEDHEVLTETPIDLSAYIPEGRGIVDAAIVTDEILYIVDFKYGAGVPVKAYQNPQMMCYALGILIQKPNVSEVSMTIFQPRIENVSSWQISADDLREWAEHTLKPAAEKAWKGEGVLIASEHCQFCKARHTCRERGKDAIEMLKVDTPVLTEEERRNLICKIPAMKSFLDDLLAWAEKDAIENGTVYPGMEVTYSTPRRQWTDPEGAAAWFIANGHSDMVKVSPPTITSSEKTIGKQLFDEALSRYIGMTESHGHLTLIKQKQIKNK